jgi:hypothetical protein
MFILASDDADPKLDTWANPFQFVLELRPALSVIEVSPAYMFHESAVFRRSLLESSRCAPNTCVTDNDRAEEEQTLVRGNFCFRSFDQGVAFRAVFDHVYHEHPTGDIVITDVLLSILLWLEPTQSTLLAVSHVSRAWREASAHLPQWSVTHQLLFPDLSSAPLRATPSELDAAVLVANTDISSVYGYQTCTRSDYVVTMQLRTSLREHILLRRRGDTKEANRVLDRCFACVTPLIFIVVGSVLALLFCALFEGGFRWGRGGDTGVGIMAGCVLAAVMTMFGVLHQAMHSWNSCVPFDKCMRQRASKPLIIVAGAVLVALGVPVALVATRITQAAALAEVPRVVYSTAICTDPSRFGFREPPVYVQLENPWEWHIEPWAAGRPAAVDNRTGSPAPLCRVPPPGRAPRTWWADTYLGNETLLAALQLEFNVTFAQADGIQCSDRLVTSLDGASYDFLMLYPPAALKAACPTVTPLALAYNPTRTDFNYTVHALWSASAHGARAAKARQLTSFRTAAPAKWFNVSWALDAGAAWFAVGLASHYGPYFRQFYDARAEESAYLWERHRIPLFVPVVVPSPEDFQASWWTREYAFFATAAAVMGAMLLVTTLPYRYVTDKYVLRIAIATAAVAVNPLWFIIWGAVCAWAHDPDVCLISGYPALFMFFFGLLCVLVTFAFIVSRTRGRCTAGKSTSTPCRADISASMHDV